MATLSKTFPPENVVLLTPDEVPEADTWEGRSWDERRQVMVIYASDKPFKQEALWAAVPGAFEAPARMAGVRLAPPGVPGGGPVVAAVPLGVTTHYEITQSYTVRTVLVRPARLQPFIEREPGVVLTDQYAPIDNLMAEVFRNRNKRRRYGKRSLTSTDPADAASGETRSAGPSVRCVRYAAVPRAESGCGSRKACSCRFSTSSTQ
jgi:hypothetical protein